CQNCASAPFTF
nr:immunoglobulin light chain junction region [Macaca mulatta]